MDFIRDMVERFKEPSSWNSIAGGIAMLGITIPTPLIQSLSYIGAGAALLVGFFLPEKKL